LLGTEFLLLAEELKHLLPVLAVRVEPCLIVGGAELGANAYLINEAIEVDRLADVGPNVFKHAGLDHAVADHDVNAAPRVRP
jgi:hypothetical protein